MRAIRRNLSLPQRMEMLWRPLAVRSAALVANPEGLVVKLDMAVTARALPLIVVQAP